MQDVDAEFPQIVHPSAHTREVVPEAVYVGGVTDPVIAEVPVAVAFAFGVEQEQ